MGRTGMGIGTTGGNYENNSLCVSPFQQPKANRRERGKNDFQLLQSPAKGIAAVIAAVPIIFPVLPTSNSPCCLPPPCAKVPILGGGWYPHVGGP